MRFSVTTAKEDDPDIDSYRENAKKIKNINSEGLPEYKGSLHTFFGDIVNMSCPYSLKSWILNPIE